MDKIAFIITTFERDELLFKSVESIIDQLETNWRIIIVDQGNTNNKKEEWIKDIRFTKPDLIHYYSVPFNSGLSYCRNFGVEKAKELDCKYCFIGSDSFLFNNSLSYLNQIIRIINEENYDLIGTELIPSVCGWEAKLQLIKGESFELDFIDKNPKNDKHQFLSHNPLSLFDIDICRNIFMATTESLLKTKWDNEMKLGEHEDFFWRYKQNGYKCGWTNSIYTKKMTDRPNEYAEYRQHNFNDGIAKLREKYSISGWVTYQHLERAKEYQKYSKLDNSK